MPATRARAFLLAGVVGPPLFVAVFLIDGFIHPAYDAITDFVSELSRGELGWLQVVNFIVLAASMLLFAIGIRWGARKGPGSAAGPIIFAIIGIGLVVDAIFVTDPHTATVQSTSGTIHDLAALPVFAGIMVACFVFARRFHGRLRVYSLATGVFVFVSFVAIFPIGSALNIIGVMQRITVLAGFAWIVVLALQLRAETARQ